jgi:hypothetical protein
MGTGSSSKQIGRMTPRCGASIKVRSAQTQFDALVVGLPWQRLPEMSVITRV